MVHTLRFVPNCSLLFTELPVLQRPAAAKAAGFDAVEFWWPWPEPVPGDAEVDAFVSAVRDAGVRLAALNFFAGDLTGPDAGVVSIPGRAQEFRDNVAVVVDIAARLDCRAFNALYGVRKEGVSPQEQDDLALANLSAAALAVAAIGGVVLIEPLSGPKPYPLRTATDAVTIIDRVSCHAAIYNIELLADLYHLAVNGDSVEDAITMYASQTGHVQIADAPGRGEPGSGTLEIGAYLDLLQSVGYDGWVGLEYFPIGATPDSFGWLSADRTSVRGAGGR